jgi:prephenate dehydrogenase
MKRRGCRRDTETNGTGEEANQGVVVRVFGRGEQAMIQAAVIGVGAMGRNHARVYKEMLDVELAAVADLDYAMASEAARLHGAQVYTDYKAMLDEVQPAMVSVAVPTHAHYRVALDWVTLSATTRQ